MSNGAARYAYLHGFASSPRSRKGVALAERFAAAGRTLHLPDLNQPSFAELTFTGALQAMDALDGATSGGPWRLIGSSMGGYLASRWAELRPERVERLVLLCPGFDLNSRWPALLGADQVARWRAQGFLTLPDGAGVPTALRWRFIEDAIAHPAYPEVPCPTRIVHGRQDEQLPIEGSREYAAGRAHVSLVEVDDDHALTASIDRIAAEVEAFFGLSDA